MTPPKRINIEILTNEESNRDAILALLEACRWLSLNFGKSVATNDTTEIVMRAKPGDRVDVQTCSVCGKYQPLVPIVCFGCIAREVRQAYGLEAPADCPIDMSDQI